MTRRDSQGGQVLAMFAGGLVLILTVAALVFDLGQSLLDRRTEQNAADAAALAGARYIPTSTGTYQGPCSSVPRSAAMQHVDTACDVAAQYLANDNLTAAVTVKYPPGPESIFSGLTSNIEVQINASRPSFFSGILGIATRATGAMGVAANSSGYTLPYSLLALDPSSCGSTGGSKVTGGGVITVGGAIHVDSNCSPDAFLISGRGAVSATSCDAAGAIQVTGGGSGCAVQNTGVQVSGDPLRELPLPTVPTNTGYFVKISGGSRTNPTGCQTAPVLTTTIPTPVGCNFPGAFSGYFYRMYPGYYPGGISLNAGTFYMEPGIYYLGGGGLSVQGASLVSTDAGGTALGGGVLIVDGQFRIASFCSGGTGPGCVGDITGNANGTTVQLKAIQASMGTIYTNMLIFVDRSTSPRPALGLNGASTVTSLEGTIYAPTGTVTLNGNGASSIASQIIAYDFVINGNTGDLNVTYQSDKLFKLAGVGLVQ